MSCGVGSRHGSDPVLLWLWCRLVTTVQIQTLACEPPYAVGSALKKKKKSVCENQKEKKKKKRERRGEKQFPGMLVVKDLA